MQEATEATPLERARAAAARAIGRARTSFSVEVDASTALMGSDLALLAGAAYAAGHLDVTIEAWERVHRASVQAGDHLAAAGAAVRVAMHLLFDMALWPPCGHGSRGRTDFSKVSGGYVGPCVARRRAQLRTTALGRLRERPTLGPASHRGGHRSRPGCRGHRTGRGGTQPHPAGRCHARSRAAQRSGRGGGRRRDSIRSGQDWCTARWSVRSRRSGNTTSPRSGRRRWRAGGTDSRLGVSMDAVVSTGPKSSGSVDAARTPRRRSSWHARSCVRTYDGSSAGR